jgi:mRNA interferase RelE/StbE
MTFMNWLKGYSYSYSKAAKKDLKKLDKNIILKIDEKLKDLVSGKQGLDIKKIVSSEAEAYRLRISNYRVVFKVQQEQILILVVAVGCRADVYKKKIGRL